MWGWFLGIAFIFGLCFGEAAKSKNSNKLAAVGFLILTLATLGIAAFFGFQGR